MMSPNKAVHTSPDSASGSVTFLVGQKMSAMPAFQVGFVISSDERYTALVRAYDRIRECKESDVWPERKEDWSPISIRGLSSISGGLRSPSWKIGSSVISPRRFRSDSPTQVSSIHGTSYRCSTLSKTVIMPFFRSSASLLPKQRCHSILLGILSAAPGACGH